MCVCVLYVRVYVCVCMCVCLCVYNYSKAMLENSVVCIVQSRACIHVRVYIHMYSVYIYVCMHTKSVPCVSCFALFAAFSG